MHSDFAMDLRAARRKSALSQDDLAILLALPQTSISQIERGTRPPSVTELYTLSLIFSRSFQSCFDEVDRQVRPLLKRRLKQLPKKPIKNLSNINRSFAIRRLSIRLADERR